MHEISARCFDGKREVQHKKIHSKRKLFIKLANIVQPENSTAIAAGKRWSKVCASDTLSMGPLNIGL